MVRIGVDTGGTFTDFVVWDGTEVRFFKQPSTPHEPAKPILLTLAEAKIAQLCHGTTVATNAILERKLAKTAFITNAGFRDLLFLGRQTRPRIYDLEPRLPKPPVEREDCFTVAGRISSDGTELEALNPELPDLRGYEAIAVCLLFSYANPTHEKEIGRLLPQNAFQSLSHIVSPEFREYERAVATCLNAAIGPTMANYLKALANDAQAESVRIMSSAGGLLSVEESIALPIRTLTSGPAAGVAAAHNLALRHGLQNAIAFDMGGTSTDVTLIAAQPAHTSLSEIAGLPARMRRIDVNTIGCGGGSLVQRDSAGAMRVGPESAGANPGPAIYGISRALTVTDANVILGRLPLFRFAAKSELQPEIERAEQAAEEASKDFGVSIDELCEAIIEVAETNMAAAIRKVSSEKGKEPSDLVLICYGGSGALHACAIAEQLNMPQVLVPYAPGVFSAMGLLYAPEMAEECVTVLGKARDWSRTYETLANAARAKLNARPTRVILFADMRYKGQSHEITVEALDSFENTKLLFENAHKDAFGTSIADRQVEWVAARVRVEKQAQPLEPSFSHKQPPSIPKSAATKWRLRSASFALFNHEELPENIEGPAIVLADDSTIFLPPKWNAQKLSDLSLRLTRTGR